MVRDSFTDVVLHSSKNYHQEHITKPRRLPKDVSYLGRCNVTLPPSFQSVCRTSCKKTLKDVTRQRPPETGIGGMGNKNLHLCAIYGTNDWIERQVFPTYDNRYQQSRDPQHGRNLSQVLAVDFVCSRSEQPCGAVVLQLYVNLSWVICFVVWR